MRAPSGTERCLRSRVQVLAFPCKPQVCRWVHRGRAEIAQFAGG